MTQFRVAIVTSNPNGNAARICHHLAQSVKNLEVGGAVVDTGSEPNRRRQVRRLAAWCRHGGVGYALWRCWLEVQARIDPQPRVTYAYPLGELGEMFDFPIVEVPNVNSAEAREALASLTCDLGISVGNRVISERVFAIPRLGMVNLHHGRIPDYRGGPPAFWELYNQEPVMGISVHRIDEKLDHGELLGSAEVPVLPGDDPRSLMARAYTVDFRLMGEVVAGLAAGSANPLSVNLGLGTLRTLPSRSQVLQLQSRLGRAVRLDDFRQAPLPELPMGQL